MTSYPLCTLNSRLLHFRTHAANCTRVLSGRMVRLKSRSHMLVASKSSAEQKTLWIVDSHSVTLGKISTPRMEWDCPGKSTTKFNRVDTPPPLNESITPSSTVKSERKSVPLHRPHHSNSEMIELVGGLQMWVFRFLELSGTIIAHRRVHLRAPHDGGGWIRMSFAATPSRYQWKETSGIRS